MGVDIKPCPFCGSDDISLYDGFEIYLWCRKCGVEGTKFKLPGYTNKNTWKLRIIYKATNAWNRRADKEKLP